MPPFICASSVYLKPSAVPGSHPGHITFGRGITSGSSRLWQFPRHALFLITLTVLKSASQVLYRMTLIGVWCFSHNLTEITEFGGGRPQRESVIPITAQDKMHQHGTAVDVISWLRKRLWYFCFLFLSFPFPSISLCLPPLISVSLTFSSTSLLPAPAMESAFLQEALAPYIGESCQRPRLVPQVCPVQLWTLAAWPWQLTG